RFGPTDDELQPVTTWLGRQGLAVARVAAGRNVIEIGGTAGNVGRAFHTELHHFLANGELPMAHIGHPQIPSAAAPVLKGVVSLHDFRKRPLVHKLDPLFDIPKGNGIYAVGPGDFNVIYDVPPGLDGHGTTIAVLGQSNIDVADVRTFRTLFGLPAN